MGVLDVPAAQDSITGLQYYGKYIFIVGSFYMCSGTTVVIVIL